MNPLHLTHIQGIFSPEHGGPCFSLANYCRGQVALGHQVTVRVLEGYPHTSPAVRLEPPVDMGVFAVDFPSKLGGSKALRRQLRLDANPDMYHIHGAWLLAMRDGAREALRRRRPYIVELMGAYERYARQQKWLRKWISRKWFQDELLRQSACLHVGSANEAADLRELGFCVPIAVIPVGVDTAAIARNDLSAATTASPQPGWGEQQFFLYLARVHPKKGIELLLEAWAAAAKQFPGYRLLIAGGGAPAYVEQCQRRAESLGVQDRCCWLGQVSDTEKSWLYQHAALYVLPSYSENFGNTVAEALAHGTPVLTTVHTPWSHLPAEGCGWVADTNVDALGATIIKALDMPSADRRRMGELGRQLVESRYSLTSVVGQLDRVYCWLLGGPRPDDILVP